jgi:hypothetical protein
MGKYQFVHMNSLPGLNELNYKGRQLMIFNCPKKLSKNEKVSNNKNFVAKPLQQCFSNFLNRNTLNQNQK